MTAVDTTAPAETMAPGIYRMTAEQYHADPVPGGSLSSTGARKMLAPSCPALFQYEREHGQEHKRIFDVGSAAHMSVLGIGAEIRVIEADNYRTKAAQEAKKEAYADGAIPLLPDEHAEIEAMAVALRQHPIAAALLDPDRGLPEQNLIWQDRQTGVMRRARFDWLPETGRGRVVIPDYKTCASAAPADLEKAVHRFGYHQQADWYLTGAQELGLADEDAAFVFICQEKTAPYLVTVIEPDFEAMRVGKARNRRALSIYQWCTETGHWPGYTEDIALVSLPPWALIEEGMGQ